jgi:hypothetical protein
VLPHLAPSECDRDLVNVGEGREVGRLIPRSGTHRGLQSKAPRDDNGRKQRPDSQFGRAVPYFILRILTSIPFSSLSSATMSRVSVSPKW